MTLGKRLKKARESLKYTQKQMAAALGTNPQTWQVYESGSSVPGGKVLESLARLGFNINWLLTGEGEVWEESCSAVAKVKYGFDLENLGRRIKVVRGTMSPEDFANSLNINEDVIFKYEDGEFEPCYSFLHLLCQKYHINTEWLLNGEGPIEKLSIPTQISFDALKIVEIYELILEIVTTRGLKLDTMNKASILKTLYKEYAKEEEWVHKENIKKDLNLILELIASNISMRSQGGGQ